MNWIRYCNLTSIIEKHLHCIQMNRLPLKGLQKVVGHSKPKFYIYCWLFKLWCCCPLYAGQPKNSRGPNKGLPRSELGVLILTVFFCHLLYSYTIVLLYYCTLILLYYCTSCLFLSTIVWSKVASWQQKQQQATGGKVTATVNIPLSCLTLLFLNIFSEVFSS